MSGIDDRLDKELKRDKEKGYLATLNQNFMTYLEIKELEQKKEEISKVYDEENEIRKEEEIRNQISGLRKELDLKREERLNSPSNWEPVASCSAICQFPYEGEKEREVLFYPGKVYTEGRGSCYRCSLGKEDCIQLYLLKEANREGTYSNFTPWTGPTSSGPSHDGAC